MFRPLDAIAKVLSRNPLRRRKQLPPRNRKSRNRLYQQLESRQMMAGDAFVGVFQNGSWTVNEDAPRQIAFGLPGDQAVSGDWNGDGKETPGVFRDGQWFLDETGNGYDSGDRTLSFGLPGDQAVAGDWDGDGVDTVGVYRNGLWYFDTNGNGYDDSDATPTSFGLPGDIAVAGDWNGDGRDTAGIFRNGTWAMDVQGNGYDHSDPFLSFGLHDALPFAGDWNGDGKDTPGLLQHDQWFFDLEGNGYNGETGTRNTLGAGTPIAGNGTYTPITASPVDLSIQWDPAYNANGPQSQKAKVVVNLDSSRPVTGDFSVRLFWANGSDLSSSRLEFAGERIASVKRFKGNVGVRFSSFDITDKPEFATHLIAVVNAGGEVLETEIGNNVRALRLK